MGLVEFAATKTLASSAVLLFITLLLLASAKRISTCILLFSAQCAVLTSQILALAFVHRSVFALSRATMSNPMPTPFVSACVHPASTNPPMAIA